jgi:RND family efflux transporter MFP subunit
MMTLLRTTRFGRHVCWAGSILAVSVLAGALAGCGEAPAPGASEPRQVAVALATTGAATTVTRLTGDIQAANEADLGFRIAGKVAERLVDVGDRITAGQVLARLDPVNETNALAAARAVRTAALGEVEQTRTAFERQDRLMSQGFTTRRQFEQAQAAMEVAQARLDEADAQVALAQDRLGFTELRADVGGVVTTRRLEAGEVIQAGQVVFRLARDDGRDAVFDVAPRFLDEKPAEGIFRIALASDPNVVAAGRVREISPQADPVTGTFRIRVGLERTPSAMALGATIVGVLEKSSALVVSVPASALTVMGADPAVWVVDPATFKVALRRVEVLRFEYARVMIAQGLQAGDMVVSGGIQALHPGQTVKPLPQPAQRAGHSNDRQAGSACPTGPCDPRRRVAINALTPFSGEADG